MPGMDFQRSFAVKGTPLWLSTSSNAFLLRKRRSRKLDIDALGTRCLAVESRSRFVYILYLRLIKLKIAHALFSKNEERQALRNILKIMQKNFQIS